MLRPTANEPHECPSTITTDDIASATIAPSSPAIWAWAVANLRPRWATVAVARSRRPSGQTGRASWTLRSSGEQTVPGGSVVATAPVDTMSARNASTPP
jgi:hypothetical protein